MATSAELSILIRAQNQATAALKAVSKDLGGLDKLVASVDKSMSSLGKGAGTGGGLSGISKALGGIGTAAGVVVKGLSGIGLAALGVEAIGGAAKGAGEALGVGLASSLEVTRAQFLAFTKSGQETDRLLAQIRTEADKTPFSFRQMAEAAASLLPASKAAGSGLQDLIQRAEILAALNPSEGLVGGAFAIKEALSGDFVSAVERFNLPRELINRLKAEGVPALEIIDQALQSMGADISLVGNVAATTQGRFSTFSDALEGLRLVAAQPILEALGEQLDSLSGFVAENKESLTEFALIIGQTLAQALRVGAKAVADLVSFFRPVGPVIMDLGRAALAMVHGDWANAMNGLLRASQTNLNFVRSAFGDVGIVLADFGQVVVDVAKGDFQGAMNQMGEAVLNTAAILREHLGDAAAVVLEAFREKFPEAAAIVLQVGGDIAAELQRFWEEVLPEFLLAWEATTARAQAAWEALAAFLGPALEEFGRFWAEHWNTIKEVLDFAWSAIAGVVQVAWEIIKTIILVGLNVLQGDWQGAWDAIVEGTTNIWNIIGGVVAKGVALVAEALHSGLEAAKALALAAWTGLWSAIQGATEAGINTLRGAFANAGPALVGLLRSGFEGAIGAFRASVAARIADIAALLPHSLAEEGPLSVPTNWEDVLTGNLPAVAKSTVGLTEDMARNIIDTLAPIVPAFDDTFDLAGRSVDGTLGRGGVVPRATEVTRRSLSDLTRAADRELSDVRSVLRETAKTADQVFGKDIPASTRETGGTSQALARLLSNELGGALTDVTGRTDAYTRSLSGVGDSLESATGLVGAYSDALKAIPTEVSTNLKVNTTSTTSGGTSGGGGGGGGGGSNKDAQLGFDVTNASAPNFSFAELNADPRYRDAPRNPDGSIKRQMGGPVREGASYLVGEAGPEMFVPSQNGTIIPHGASALAMRGGMGGGGPVINVSVSGNTLLGDDRAMAEQLADIIMRSLSPGAAAHIQGAIDRNVRLRLG